MAGDRAGVPQIGGEPPYANRIVLTGTGVAHFGRIDESTIGDGLGACGEGQIMGGRGKGGKR